VSGADPQGASRSRLLSAWKPFRQAQCTAFGLDTESNLFDFHELRRDFSPTKQDAKRCGWAVTIIQQSRILLAQEADFLYNQASRADSSPLERTSQGSAAILVSECKISRFCAEVGRLRTPYL